jgi:hypothetical protein
VVRDYCSVSGSSQGSSPLPSVNLAEPGSSSPVVTQQELQTKALGPCVTDLGPRTGSLLVLSSLTGFKTPNYKFKFPLQNGGHGARVTRFTTEAERALTRDKNQVHVDPEQPSHLCPHLHLRAPCLQGPPLNL